jgi:hypothetical protein
MTNFSVIPVNFLTWICLIVNFPLELSTQNKHPYETVVMRWHPPTPHEKCEEGQLKADEEKVNVFLPGFGGESE